MEIRSCEGCVDFDSPEKPSVQLEEEWDEKEFMRETADVFKKIARNGRITRDDMKRYLMQNKFQEQRGRNKTLPHEIIAEIDATFNELDLSGTGYVTLSEFRRYHRMRFQKVVQELRDYGQ
eukprot:TRINITY_DN47724_c0_g1_i1.p1 TRINITY_DN47724_c0_g1~~TRINITY_DN47724_c0_g1_i1.p1  ORF type:complete len:121 (+),score=32.01 TRINITY_DN47724_c0_g1_i1:51-413(+)